jgi:hypothetical protein
MNSQFICPDFLFIDIFFTHEHKSFRLQRHDHRFAKELIGENHCQIITVVIGSDAVKINRLIFPFF